MNSNDELTVAYVMSRFPKLTETFILAELEAMDRAGVRIELFPLLRQTGEPVQPAAVGWVERAHYLPFLSLPILRAQWWFLRDRQRRRRYLGAFFDMLGETWRSPNFFLGGLGIFPKVARMAGVRSALSIEYLMRKMPASTRATAPSHTSQREVSRSSMPARGGDGGGGSAGADAAASRGSWTGSAGCAGSAALTGSAAAAGSATCSSACRLACAQTRPG